MSEKQTTKTQLRDALLRWTEGAQASSWSLVALLVLIPVLAIPQFTTVGTVIKLLLLFIVSSFAAFAYIAHTYRVRGWLHRSNWMIWTPLLLWLTVAISAAASASGAAGWYGSLGQGYTAAWPLLALLLVYGLVLHVGEGVQYVRRYSLAALVGVLLAMLWTGLELVGVSLAGSIGFPGFSPVGPFESMLILGVVATLLCVGAWLTADETKEDTWLPNDTWRYAFYGVGGVVTLATLAGMLLTDTWPSQLVLLAGSAVLVGLGLFDPKRFRSPSRVLAVMLLFAFSLILFIAPMPWNSPVPVEANLSFGAANQIAVETLKVDGPFGAGPASYVTSYTRFKPDVLASTPFGSLTVDRAPSHVLFLFTTWGFVPTLIFVAFLLMVLTKLSAALLWEKDREDWQVLAVLGSVWVALVASQIVYASTLSIQLLFWVVTGLLLAHLMRKTRVVEFKPGSRAALLLSLGFVGGGVFFVLALAVSLQWGTSEVLMAHALHVQRAGDQSGQVVELVGRAASLNKWNAAYARTLAQAHLAYLDTIAVNPEENAEAIQHAAESAIALSQRAVELGPVDVRNVRLAADTFTVLMPIVSGADAEAVSANRYARDLDPANPNQHLALTRSLLVASDTAFTALPEGEERNELIITLLAEAEEATNAALALQESETAIYLRTLVYERQGRINEAIQAIEGLALQSPQDPVLRFELGVLQLRAGNKDLARSALEQALVISPTYANAKWYLAALYEEAGELDAAVQQLEDLLTFNPDDTTVQDKLNLIRAGQAEAAAAEEVEPLEE